MLQGAFRLRIGKNLNQHGNLGQNLYLYIWEISGREKIILFKTVNARWFLSVLGDLGKVAQYSLSPSGTQ